MERVENEGRERRSKKARGKGSGNMGGGEREK